MKYLNDARELTEHSRNTIQVIFIIIYADNPNTRCAYIQGSMIEHALTDDPRFDLHVS